MPRDSVVEVPDQFLLDCFAALLFRYTRQSRISLTHGAQITRYTVTGSAVVAELPRVEGPPPVRDEGCELLLDVGQQAVELHYDPALFDAVTADQLLAHLRTLTADAASAPRRPIELLRLMSDAELHTMLRQWNDTERPREDDACLHTAFVAAAGRQPAAIAVVHQGRRWTYAEVNSAANRLAHYLRTRGVGPDVRVGIYLGRSPGLLIGMLAVLKAGGAFVPIDPHHPQARVATMVSGSSCALIITDSRLAGDLDAQTTPQLLLDRDAELLAAQPPTDPEPVAGPENLCYIIHTSGSTGAPKAIALRHRGVTNNLEDLITRYGIGAADSVLALSSPSFDMSIFEFLGLTAAGGTVVIPDPDRTRDPAHWAQLIADERVTIWNSAPALLGLLTDHAEQVSSPASLPSLRLALLGGDWVPLTLPDRARHASPGMRVTVMGGATEASIHSTIFEVEDIDPAWTSIPYGRPMANQRTYILDEAAQPVPPGVAGELYLAGTGLARGYLDQPELTAERFLDWSFGEIRGERLYRTGDLARYGRDGLIELLGRIDLQVKINGHRIELGEIESVLSSHPEVQQVALATRNNQLVAYVVLSCAVAPEQLIDLAAERLPGYMVPAHVVVMDRLPLSPNGKVDRAALPAPDLDRSPWQAARTPVERVLADIVSELLDGQPIGVDDDFLFLGGDSVRAIQLVSRAKARGVVITAAQVLELRTVAALAAAAVTTQPSPSPERAAAVFDQVEEADRDELSDRYPDLVEIWPLTPLQTGILFELLLEDDDNGGSYRLQTKIELTGAPAPDRVRDACARLVARHASLRTAFVSDVADEPAQVVLSALEPPWRHVDLTHLDVADRDRALGQLLDEERGLLPDPDSPPLLRFALISLEADRALLVLTAYHLLYDGWSEGVMARELAELYAGVELPPPGDFRDYLHWLGQQDPTASIQAWQDRLSGLDGPTLLAPGLDLTEPTDMREEIIAIGRHELVPDHRLLATRSAIAQAAWAIVLGELTGRADVVFGVTVSGRPGELAGVESMVGMLINTIPMRVRLNPEQSIADLFTQLASAQVSMLAHEHLGLIDIHQAVDATRLFDTLVVCQSFPAAGPGNDALGLGKIHTSGIGNYPLTLLVEMERLIVQYDARCHDAEGVVAIAERFREVAAQLTAGAYRTDLALPLAAPAARPGHA
jgi:amino acid adenylation domain-containing protein